MKIHIAIRYNLEHLKTLNSLPESQYFNMIFLAFLKIFFSFNFYPINIKFRFMIHWTIVHKTEATL